MVAIVTLSLLAACSDPGGSPEDADVPRQVFSLGTRLEAPRPVGPPAGHQLDPLDRDAGVNARLRDGSMIWFFGDTGQRAPDGGLATFTVGTAAWAPADAPFETMDYADDGAPVAFARPTEAFPPCPPSSPVAGMWPLATAVEQRGDRDRVVLWMQNICLGSSTVAATRGVSVGEWYYDPDAPPVDERIEVTVLNQVVFDDSSLGGAAFVDDGRVVVYGCDIPPSPLDPAAYGPCRVARVDFDDVADRDAYEVWTGGETWTAGAEATPMELASTVEAAPGPAGPLTVMPLPGTDRFVMGYTPWPGFIDVVAVRVADRPEGPWSDPQFVQLPECGVAGRQDRPCYGSNLQPAFSSERELAIGYQDPFVAEDPIRGSFLVGSVPFEMAE